MNPYATPSNVCIAHPRGCVLPRVVRRLIWITASAILVAILLHPAEPKLAAAREALGVANWLLPLMPFVIYELLCRESPRSLGVARSITSSASRCVLTYCIPFCISQFAIFQMYPSISYLLWAGFGVHLTSNRPYAATSFAVAGISALLYDVWRARRLAVCDLSTVCPDGG